MYVVSTVLPGQRTRLHSGCGAYDSLCVVTFAAPFAQIFGCTASLYMGGNPATVNNNKPSFR